MLCSPHRLDADGGALGWQLHVLGGHGDVNGTALLHCRDICHQGPDVCQAVSARIASVSGLPSSSPCEVGSVRPHLHVQASVGGLPSSLLACLALRHKRQAPWCYSQPWLGHRSLASFIECELSIRQWLVLLRECICVSYMVTRLHSRPDGCGATQC